MQINNSVLLRYFLHGPSHSVKTIHAVRNSKSLYMHIHTVSNRSNVLPCRCQAIPLPSEYILCFMYPSLTKRCHKKYERLKRNFRFSVLHLGNKCQKLLCCVPFLCLKQQSANTAFHIWCLSQVRHTVLHRSRTLYFPLIFVEIIHTEAEF